MDPVLAQQAVAAMPTALAVIGQDGRVVATNEAWRNDGGAGTGEHLTASGPVASDGTAELVEGALHRVLTSRGASVELEVPDPGGDGTRWSLLHLAGLGSAGAVVTRIDVTRAHEVLDLVAASAVRDPLTGLPHRTLLEDRIGSAVARVERGVARPAVLFLDLDRFKDVNDQHGHEVGDRVLTTIARRLSSELRAADTCGRWGGDEFLVVVELDAGRVDDDLRLVMDRLCAAVDVPVDVDGRAVRVGLSIGAVVVAPGDSVERLVTLADAAMYDAKRSGHCAAVADRDVVDLRGASLP